MSCQNPNECVVTANPFFFRPSFNGIKVYDAAGNRLCDDCAYDRGRRNGRFTRIFLSPEAKTVTGESRAVTFEIHNAWDIYMHHVPHSKHHPFYLAESRHVTSHVFESTLTNDNGIWRVSIAGSHSLAWKPTHTVKANRDIVRDIVGDLPSGAMGKTRKVDLVTEAIIKDVAIPLIGSAVWAVKTLATKVSDLRPFIRDAAAREMPDADIDAEMARIDYRTLITFAEMIAFPKTPQCFNRECVEKQTYRGATMGTSHDVGGLKPVIELRPTGIEASQDAADFDGEARKRSAAEIMTDLLEVLDGDPKRRKELALEMYEL